MSKENEIDLGEGFSGVVKVNGVDARIFMDGDFRVSAEIDGLDTCIFSSGSHFMSKEGAKEVLALGDNGVFDGVLKVNGLKFEFNSAKGTAFKIGKDDGKIKIFTYLKPAATNDHSAADETSDNIAHSRYDITGRPMTIFN